MGNHRKSKNSKERKKSVKKRRKYLTTSTSEENVSDTEETSETSESYEYILTKKKKGKQRKGRYHGSATDSKNTCNRMIRIYNPYNDFPGMADSSKRTNRREKRSPKKKTDKEINKVKVRSSFRKDTPNCPLCDEPFKSPIILACAHTFCKQCVTDLVERGDGKSYQCPVCLSVSALSGNDEELFCPNFVILQDMESDSVEDYYDCSVCEDGNEADFYCKNCSDLLCDECYTAHQIVNHTKDHKVNKISSTTDIQKLIRKKYHCIEHENEPLAIYCVTCGQSICRECAFAYHPGDTHNCLSIEDAVIKNRDSMRRKMFDIQSRKPKSQLLLLDIKRIKTLLRNQVELVRSDISTSMNKLIKALREKEKELYRSVDSIYATKINKLKYQKDAVILELEKYEAVNQVLIQLDKHDNDVEMLQMKEAIETSLAMLENSEENVTLDIDTFLLRSNEGNIISEIGKHGEIYEANKLSGEVRMIDLRKETSAIPNANVGRINNKSKNKNNMILFSDVEDALFAINTNTHISNDRQVTGNDDVTDKCKNNDEFARIRAQARWKKVKTLIPDIILLGEYQQSFENERGKLHVNARDNLYKNIKNSQKHAEKCEKGDESCQPKAKNRGNVKEESHKIATERLASLQNWNILFNGMSSTSNKEIRRQDKQTNGTKKYQKMDDNSEAEKNQHISNERPNGDDAGSNWDILIKKVAVQKSSSTGKDHRNASEGDHNSNQTEDSKNQRMKNSKDANKSYIESTDSTEALDFWKTLVGISSFTMDELNEYKRGEDHIEVEENQNMEDQMSHEEFENWMKLIRGKLEDENHDELENWNKIIRETLKSENESNRDVIKKLKKIAGNALSSKENENEALENWNKIIRETLNSEKESSRDTIKKCKIIAKDPASKKEDENDEALQDWNETMRETLSNGKETARDMLNKWKKIVQNRLSKERNQNEQALKDWDEIIRETLSNEEESNRVVIDKWKEITKKALLSENDANHSASINSNGFKGASSKTEQPNSAEFKTNDKSTEHLSLSDCDNKEDVLDKWKQLLRGTLSAERDEKNVEETENSSELMGNGKETARDMFKKWKKIVQNRLSKERNQNDEALKAWDEIIRETLSNEEESNRIVIDKWKEITKKALLSKNDANDGVSINSNGFKGASSKTEQSNSAEFKTNDKSTEHLALSECDNKEDVLDKWKQLLRETLPEERDEKNVEETENSSELMGESPSNKYDEDNDPIENWNKLVTDNDAIENRNKLVTGTDNEPIENWNRLVKGTLNEMQQPKSSRNEEINKLARERLLDDGGQDAAVDNWKSLLRGTLPYNNEICLEVSENWNKLIQGTLPRKDGEDNAAIENWNKLVSERLLNEEDKDAASENWKCLLRGTLPYNNEIYLEVIKNWNALMRGTSTNKDNARNISFEDWNRLIRGTLPPNDEVDLEVIKTWDKLIKGTLSNKDSKSDDAIGNWNKLVRAVLPHSSERDFEVFMNWNRLIRGHIPRKSKKDDSLKKRDKLGGDSSQNEDETTNEYSDEAKSCTSKRKGKLEDEIMKNWRFLINGTGGSDEKADAKRNIKVKRKEALANWGIIISGAINTDRTETEEEVPYKVRKEKRGRLTNSDDKTGDKQQKCNKDKMKSKAIQNWNILLKGTNYSESDISFSEKPAKRIKESKRKRREKHEIEEDPYKLWDKLLRGHIEQVNAPVKKHVDSDRAFDEWRLLYAGTPLRGKEKKSKSSKEKRSKFAQEKNIKSSKEKKKRPKSRNKEKTKSDGCKSDDNPYEKWNALINGKTAKFNEEIVLPSLELNENTIALWDRLLEGKIIRPRKDQDKPIRHWSMVVSPSSASLTTASSLRSAKEMRHLKRNAKKNWDVLLSGSESYEQYEGKQPAGVQTLFEKPTSSKASLDRESQFSNLSIKPSNSVPEGESEFLNLNVKTSKGDFQNVKLQLSSPDNSILSAHIAENSDGTFTIFCCPRIESNFNMFVSLQGDSFKKETRVVNLYGDFSDLKESECELACKTINLIRWHLTPGLLTEKDGKIIPISTGYA